MTPAPLLLAQFVSDGGFGNEAYLGYFLLGLVLCFGYIAFRLLSNKKKDEREDWQGIDAALRDAERQVREEAAIRRARDSALAAQARPAAAADGAPEADAPDSQAPKDDVKADDVPEAEKPPGS